MLGDKHLDAAENLAKLKEGNKALTDRQKIAGQSELENPDRMLGSRMPYQELVRKITKLNPGILVKDGSAGQIAIYVPKTRKELEESANEDKVYDPTRYAWHKDFKYVTGCGKEPLPEYSGMLVDERGRPHREIRGWRSILIALVKNKAITYQQAEAEFGPAMGQRSWRYEEQLQSHR